MATSKSRCAKNVMTLLVTMALLFVVSEAIVRVFYHREHLETVIRFDPVVGWSLEPGARHHAQHTQSGLDYHIEINSMGMREDEFDPVKAPGKKRILVLGDSFVFGAGVEARWRMSDILDRALGDDIEVINAGVSGWGTDQELVNYVTRLRQIQPDMVVLTMMVANDIINNDLDHLFLGSSPKPYFKLREGELQWSGPVAQPPPPPLTIKQLLRRSQFLSLVKRGVDAFTQRPEPERGVAAASGLEPEWIRSGYSHWLVFEQTHDTLAHAWLVTEALLARFSRVCAEDGAEFVVLAFPSKIEVDDEWRERLLARADVDPATLDLDMPYRRLDQFCESSGIDFLYPIDAFRAEARTRPLYFRLDGHPNRYGHVTAARALLEHLESRYGLHFNQAPVDKAEVVRF